MYHLDEIRPQYQNGGDKPKKKKNTTSEKPVDLTPIDLQTMYANNPQYGGNKYMDTVLLRNMDNFMIRRNLGYPQRVAMATNVHQEGNKLGSHGNGAYGLVGWRGGRATPIIGANDSVQFQYLYDTTMGEFDNSQWHHGGKGSRYNTALEAQQAFQNADNVKDATRALTYGYVRPPAADRPIRLANVRGLITPRTKKKKK